MYESCTSVAAAGGIGLRATVAGRQRLHQAGVQGCPATGLEDAAPISTLRWVGIARRRCSRSAPAGRVPSSTTVHSEVATRSPIRLLKAEGPLRLKSPPPARDRWPRAARHRPARSQHHGHGSARAGTASRLISACRTASRACPKARSGSRNQPVADPAAAAGTALLAAGRRVSTITLVQPHQRRRTSPASVPSLPAIRIVSQHGGQADRDLGHARVLTTRLLASTASNRLTWRRPTKRFSGSRRSVQRRPLGGTPDPQARYRRHPAGAAAVRFSSAKRRQHNLVGIGEAGFPRHSSPGRRHPAGWRGWRS